jgi:hypothetical protein
MNASSIVTVSLRETIRNEVQAMLKNGATIMVDERGVKVAVRDRFKVPGSKFKVLQNIYQSPRTEFFILQL